MTLYETPGPHAAAFSSAGVIKFGAGVVTTSRIPVWDGGTAYTYFSTATALKCSSSSASDTGNLTIVGLDANNAIQTVTQALGGQAETAVGTATWNRVYRAYNPGASAYVGDVYVYEDDTVSAGVPQTASKLKAKIAIGNGQTLMAIYAVPAGYNGYLWRWWWDASGVSTNEVCTIDLIACYTGGVPRVQFRHYVQSAGQGSRALARPLILPPVTDIYVSAKTSSGNATLSAGFDIDLWPV